jgi:hypothetical protein
MLNDTETLQPTGQVTFVAELRIGSTTGDEAPEDAAGFDIP